MEIETNNYLPFNSGSARLIKLSMNSVFIFKCMCLLAKHRFIFEYSAET